MPRAGIGGDVDLYGVLGVTSDASASDIRAAYKRRALQAHPDKGGSPEAFRLVILAFETLFSSRSRLAYDNQVAKRKASCCGLLKRRWHWQRRASDQKDGVTVAGGGGASRSKRRAGGVSCADRRPAKDAAGKPSDGKAKKRKATCKERLKLQIRRLHALLAGCPKDVRRAQIGTMSSHLQQVLLTWMRMETTRSSSATATTTTTSPHADTTINLHAVASAGGEPGMSDGSESSDDWSDKTEMIAGGAWLEDQREPLMLEDGVSEDSEEVACRHDGIEAHAEARSEVAPLKLLPAKRQQRERLCDRGPTQEKVKEGSRRQWSGRQKSGLYERRRSPRGSGRFYARISIRGLMVRTQDTRSLEQAIHWHTLVNAIRHRTQELEDAVLSRTSAAAASGGASLVGSASSSCPQVDPTEWAGLLRQAILELDGADEIKLTFQCIVDVRASIGRRIFAPCVQLEEGLQNWIAVEEAKKIGWPALRKQWILWMQQWRPRRWGMIQQYSAEDAERRASAAEQAYSTEMERKQRQRELQESRRMKHEDARSQRLRKAFWKESCMIASVQLAIKRAEAAVKLWLREVARSSPGTRS